MFLRNVGHLMTNPAILYGGGKEIPEGILDAVVTTAIAMHDLKGHGADGIRNSRTGSVYIVKPKMHGPAEVAFAGELFGRVEQLLGLPANTVKLGIMDEERRTSVNLQGLHRRGRRARGLHQHRLPRPHRRRDAHRHAGRPDAAQGRHEDQRLDPGLREEQRAGRPGLRPARQAQIGKGMWAMPDLMAAMLEQKIAHPKAGANTAWVPSPTAATLHALHYHQVDVAEVQKELEKIDADAERDKLLTGLLQVPVAREAELDGAEQASRSSTTTCRASWATWCAGSTRASAAPRCPTSTTSA